MPGAAHRLILCFGSTPTLQRTMRFGRLQTGGVNRAAEVHEHASGKAINVARVVHALGRPCLALVPLGGARGERVQRDLAETAIPAEAISVEAETRLCVTVIDEAAGQATELIEEHAPLPPAVGGRLLEALEAKLARASALVLSGSVAAGLDHGIYAEAVRLARRASVPAVVDASGAPLRAALAERPDVVKINRSEFAGTFEASAESDFAVQSAISALARDFGGWLIVTDGRAGSYASDGNRLWHISAPTVETLSPIGSGDAFAAGLVVAMVDGATPPDVFRLAAACGAANASTPHAGNLDPQRVVELEPQVVIQKLPM